MTQEKWKCPWCHQTATRETERVICESRTCDCGAIALSARVEDSDEIIDDAVNVFGVHIQETSCGFSDLIIADIVQSGVEVKGGILEGAPLPTKRCIWFRRAGFIPLGK